MLESDCESRAHGVTGSCPPPSHSRMPECSPWGSSLGQRRRRCSFLERMFSSSPTLRVLLPPLCAVAVVSYGLVHELYNFMFGVFIPQYHCPYTAPLCLAQVVMTLLVLNLLHLLGVVHLQPFSCRLGEQLLVPAVCESTHAVLTLWAKANSAFAGPFRLTERLLPLLTSAWSFGLRLAEPPSGHVSVVVSMVSGVSIVITASEGVSSVDPVEYFYAPLAVVLHSLSLTWLAKVSESEQHLDPEDRASVCDVFYAQLLDQGLVLGLLCLLHPDTSRLLGQGSWHSLLFHAYLLAILLLGTALSSMVSIWAMSFSPLTATLVHSARGLVEPFLRLL